jgi:hypothetical protein
MNTTRADFGPHFVLLLIAFLALMMGCSQESQRPSKTSPAAYFEETQRNTTLPDGDAIKPGSVQDTGDGRLRYATEKGRKMEVSYRPDGDGYRYFGVKGVKSSTAK